MYIKPNFTNIDYIYLICQRFTNRHFMIYVMNFCDILSMLL